MATLNDRVYDQGLSTLVSEADRIDICSSEPTTYTQATTSGSVSLGNKTSITLTGPADGDTSGRKVTVPQITGGSVSSGGSATHFAISDTSGSGRLLVTGSLSSPQTVASGNSFSLTSLDIELPDPA